MNTLKLATLVAWAIVVVVGIPTIYLAFLNRASARFATSFPTALAAGVVGTFVTLVFSLERDSRSIEVPVEYVIDGAEGVPLSPAAFPEAGDYFDPGSTTGAERAWLVAPKLPAARALEEVLKKQPVEQLIGAEFTKLYRDVLTRQIIGVLEFMHLKSWDAEPARFLLPSGGGQITYAARENRAGVKLSKDDLRKILGSNEMLAHEHILHLNLPPDSTLSFQSDATAATLEIRNPFATISIRIVARGVEKGLGTLRRLCRVPVGKDALYLRPRYLISLSATFSAIRSGHPEMPLYRHWVDTMFAELQEFSSPRRWERLKEAYQLFYANGQPSPLDELVRDAEAKVRTPSQ